MWEIGENMGQWKPYSNILNAAIILYNIRNCPVFYRH